MGTPGHIGWHELYAGDLDEAFSFYSSLFGWVKKEAFEMGDMGPYQLFGLGEAMGGMMKRPPQVPVACWLYYFNVEDIDAPRNPGLVYGVYVNVPAGATADEREAYHVGNVSLFGIEAVQDRNRIHSVPGLRHTFNISHLVERLRAANTWDPDTIDVSFEPIVPVASPSPATGVAPEMPQLRTAGDIPVRIGRVSLFIG